MMYRLYDFLNGKINLNTVAIAWQNGKCTPLEYLEYNMGLGYSVSGLSDVMASHEAFENWEIENPLWDDE